MKLSTAGFSAPRSAAASADPPLCTRARHKAAGGAGPRASDTQDRAKHGSAAGLLPASAWRRGEEALGWGKFSLRTKERVPPGQPRATRSSIITPPSNPTPLAAAAHPIPGSLSQPLPKVPTSLVGTRALGASAGPQHSWLVASATCGAPRMAKAPGVFAPASTVRRISARFHAAPVWPPMRWLRGRPFATPIACRRASAAAKPPAPAAQGCQALRQRRSSRAGRRRRSAGRPARLRRRLLRMPRALPGPAGAAHAVTA